MNPLDELIRPEVERLSAMLGPAYAVTIEQSYRVSNYTDSRTQWSCCVTPIATYFGGNCGMGATMREAVEKCLADFETKNPKPAELQAA